MNDKEIFMYKSQQGYSLLEVISSITILSIVLFTLLHLQFLALQISRSSLDNTSAVFLLQSVCNYFKAMPTANEKDLFFWKKEIEESVPRGTIEIDQNKIQISWFDRLSQKIVSQKCFL